MEFYAYLWLREDGTPYYVGKGTWLASLSKNDHHQRVYTKHRGSGVHPPKDRSRILIFERFNEAEAFATEKELIVNWGRKDLGTGCLHNRTEGGDGASGFKWTEKQKQAIVGKRSGEKCYWLFGKRGPETPRFGKKAPHSEETKHKMSEIRRGRKLSEEHRKAVAAGQRTDKARAAMSATIKEWWRIRKAQKENSNSI
jgi:hypothetical protein